MLQFLQYWIEDNNAEIKVLDKDFNKLDGWSDLINITLKSNQIENLEIMVKTSLDQKKPSSFVAIKDLKSIINFFFCRFL